MVSVNVGDKMYIELIFIKLECLYHHCWPEVGAANSNIDYIGNGFTSVAGMCACYDAI